MSMGDLSFSMELRDTLKRMIREFVDAERPRYRYAQVESIDRVARTCAVVYNGETGSVQVNMGALQPSKIGQYVRIEGIGTDKFIADVIGDPYFTELAVDRLRVKAATDVDPAGSDATDPVIIGNETGAHLAVDSDEIVAYSSPGVVTRVGLNSGAYIPDDQVTNFNFSVPNLKWVIDRIASSTTAAGPFTLALIGDTGTITGAKPTTYWRDDKGIYVVSHIKLGTALPALATRAVADLPTGYRPVGGVVSQATNLNARYEVSTAGRINVVNGSLAEIAAGVPLPMHIIIPR